MPSRRSHNDTPDEELPKDDAAQRIVQLLFVLNATRTPLTTEQIVSDSDLGYGSGNVESDRKKFKRDREKLLKQGIVIREVKPEGSAETEESRWEIDRQRTYSTLGLISADDAQLLLEAIDDHLQREDIPYRHPLERMRARMRDVLAWKGGTPMPSVLQESSAIEEAVWDAYAQRKRLAFSYIDASGRSSKRTVAIYGFFSLEGHGYLVGQDEAREAMRTFRIDRIQRAWKPTGSYRIPDDFRIEDHLFFSFDLGDEQPVDARFTFSDGAQRSELESLTYGRGALSRREDGRWEWRIPVRNLTAAAALCLTHRNLGMKPAEPSELVTEWVSLIRKAVAAHGGA